MKKILLLLTSLLAIIFIFFKINSKSPDFPYTQEYIIGNTNIQGEVNTDYFSNKNNNFEIAANQNGQAVFKNPSLAFKNFKKDYASELKKVQKTFNLLPLTHSNFDSYKNYAFQITDISSSTEQENLTFISSFLDIYENSFKEK